MRSARPAKDSPRRFLVALGWFHRSLGALRARGIAKRPLSDVSERAQDAHLRPFSGPIVLGVVSFAVMLVAWEAGARIGWLNPFFTSQPTAIGRALVDETRSGELARGVSVSLIEFALGFGAAIAVGLALGIAAGWFRTVEYALDPFIWFVYSAPLIAFYPLFVLWLGLGTRTVMAISFLLSVTPITVNTTAGIRGINPLLLLAARSLGARPRDLLWKVAVPASVPMIAAGLRLGVGRALTGVVIAELFVPSGGLGSSIAYNAGLLKTTNMLASLTVVVLIGVICTQTLSALEAKFSSWRTGPGL
jgi:ABC-type nitrate/sulfonate/bicarbonate transport system permease component